MRLGGEGGYYGVDNQSADCPECITGRVVAGGYSDAIPVPATPDEAGRDTITDEANVSPPPPVPAAPDEAAVSPPTSVPAGPEAPAPAGTEPVAEPGAPVGDAAPAAGAGDPVAPGRPRSLEAGGTEDAVAPVCPTAPTPGEVASAVADSVPAPSIGVNPEPRGITGLDAWLWHEGPIRVTTTTSVRGFLVTTTVRARAFWWDTGDPAVSLLRSTRPGSRRSPAVTHLYEAKGVYRLRAGVAWGGVYGYTGCSAGTDALPGLEVTGERDYRVVEIRSVLTG